MGNCEKCGKEAFPLHIYTDKFEGLCETCARVWLRLFDHEFPNHDVNYPSHDEWQEAWDRFLGLKTKIWRIA